MKCIPENPFTLLLNWYVVFKKVVTEHLLNDGGHEEGDGDHGGGEHDEAEGRAGHNDVRRPVLLVIVIILLETEMFWFRMPFNLLL